MSVGIPWNLYVFPVTGFWFTHVLQDSTNQLPLLSRAVNSSNMCALVWKLNQLLLQHLLRFLRHRRRCLAEKHHAFDDFEVQPPVVAGGLITTLVWPNLQNLQLASWWHNCLQNNIQQQAETWHDWTQQFASPPCQPRRVSSSIFAALETTSICSPDRRIAVSNSCSLTNVNKLIKMCFGFWPLQSLGAYPRVSDCLSSYTISLCAAFQHNALAVTSFTYHNMFMFAYAAMGFWHFQVAHETLGPKCVPMQLPMPRQQVQSTHCLRQLMPLPPRRIAYATCLQDHHSVTNDSARPRFERLGQNIQLTSAGPFKSLETSCRSIVATWGKS